MAKKQYISPVLALHVDDDPTIVMGGSQGTGGYDSPYTFSGIESYIQDLIALNCDDYDLQDMDADGNFKITSEEFYAWCEENKPDWLN